MELYEITIQPVSAFGTPLKGDTIFGHFCWQAAHYPELLEQGLEAQLAKYSKDPFAVFSSAYPKTEYKGTSRFFKRPDISLKYFKSFQKLEKKEKINQAKEIKKKKWIQAKGRLEINLQKNTLFSDKELVGRLQQDTTVENARRLRKIEARGIVQTVSLPHNSINRLTNSTGSGMFAPYSLDVFYYLPETELVVFVLINTKATDIERIITGLERIGKWGFGRDASTGLGKFEVAEADPVPLPSFDKADALYTLAPAVPEKNMYQHSFFSPFVRYGKHGDMLAVKGRPFKNPVIMADEGAIFIPADKQLINRPFLGRSVTDVSKAMPETVVQGYSPVLPLKFG
ncbi:MAG: hypothetical protein R6U68_07570 [Desulfobacteraceae bacterium]